LTELLGPGGNHATAPDGTEARSRAAFALGTIVYARAAGERQRSPRRASKSLLTHGIFSALANGY
jgi:hypothetical protein